MAEGWAGEVRGRGVLDVAAALGLTERRRTVAPCPACGAERRGSSDPRGPIGLTRDALGWHCHRCQAHGDGVTLAAYHALGRAPLAGDREAWHAVRDTCARLGLCEADRPIGPVVRRPAPAPLPAAEAPPRRHPAADIAAVWNACTPVSRDPEVAAWLRGRGLDVARVEDDDLARALSQEGELPRWCTYRGRSWRETHHRVILPCYDSAGMLTSVHARAVGTASPRDKAAWPAGAEVAGVVFADAVGRAMLAGTVRPRVVVIAEGPPDYLTWATRYGEAAEDAPAVLGVTAGAWHPDLAARVPDGAVVIVRTHDDDAGRRYADRIIATLAGRCECRRPRTTSPIEARP